MTRNLFLAKRERSPSLPSKISSKWNLAPKKFNTASRHPGARRQLPLVSRNVFGASKFKTLGGNELLATKYQKCEKTDSWDRHKMCCGPTFPKDSVGIGWPNRIGVYPKQIRAEAPAGNPSARITYYDYSKAVTTE